MRGALRALLLVLVLTGCAQYGPTLLAVGGALLEVAAANYGGDYAAEVQNLVAVFNRTSQAALARYLQLQSEQAQLQASTAIGAQGGAMQAQAMAQTAQPPISLDVALMKRLGSDAVEIADGAVLIGPTATAEGDRLRIFFRPSIDAWVYVIAVDSSGWVQPLFPSSLPDTFNPVRAGDTYLLPNDSFWYGLDQVAGVQHVYFVASYGPRADIEQSIAQFAGQERPTPTRVRPVAQPYVAEGSWISARGLTGLQQGPPALIRPPMGAAYSVQPTTFGFDVPGADFVLTRYFDHR